jgi:hypothetical protein
LGRREPGIEAGWNRPKAPDRDLWTAQLVQRCPGPIEVVEQAGGGGDITVHDLPAGVDAAIGAAGTDDLHLGARQAGQGVFEHTLHRALPSLPGETGEARPVVGEVDPDPDRDRDAYRPSSERSSRSSTMSSTASTC